MNSVRKFIKAFNVPDRQASDILGVSAGNLSDWKCEKRAVPAYIERSIALHLNTSEAHKNRLKEQYK